MRGPTRQPMVTVRRLRRPAPQKKVMSRPREVEVLPCSYSAKCLVPGAGDPPPRSCAISTARDDPIVRRTCAETHAREPLRRDESDRPQALRTGLLRLEQKGSYPDGDDSEKDPTHKRSDAPGTVSFFFQMGPFNSVPTLGLPRLSLMRAQDVPYTSFA
jgi:hypothetical protein